MTKLTKSSKLDRALGRKHCREIETAMEIRLIL